MPLSKARRVVTSAGWLSRQDPAFQDRLLAKAELRTVNRGDGIYGLGDDFGGIYGVTSGYVDVLIAPGPFSPILVHIGGPGWWVGDGALITRSPRRAGLTARTDVELLFVPAREFDEVCQDDPAAWRRLARLTVSHLDNALLHLACIAADDHFLRIATTIARLAGLPDENPAVVELPLNQRELAEIVRLSRNVVGRHLGTLVAQGCVETKYGRMVVDSVRLREQLVRSH